jgi:uncharacterized protein YfaS (alpha-2-macroglobulin family)
MPNPTASVSLDKTSYNTGDTITATVTYTDPNTTALTVTTTVTDSTGQSSTPATATAVLNPATVSTTDSGGRTWAKQSDNGSVAVFTATA